MSEPLISVIVPIYRTEPYLTRCVTSLREQTYRNLEILLIDDGSPDGAPALCDAFAAQDARIRVIHRENGGISAARNTGLDAMTGEWFTFVDSDDCVMPTYVEYLYGLVTDFACPMAVCGYDIAFPDGKRQLRSAGTSRYAISPKSCMERLFYDDFVTVGPWAKLYHRSLVGEIRYPEGMLFEDAGTTYRFILSCPHLAFGEESQYVYAVRPQSIVTSDFAQSKFDLLPMSDQMCEDTVACFPDLADAALRRRVYVRFSTLNQMLDTDRFPERRREMIRFIRRNGFAVFFNAKAPNRDRAALLMLLLGYPLYRRAWKWYVRKFK